MRYEDSSSPAEIARFSCFRLFALLLCISLVVFVALFYRARRVFFDLRNQGMPMPPWSPVFGHLKFAASLMATLPNDCHPHYLAGEIRRMMPELGPLFYLDMWPFGPQMLVISSPDAAFQVTQKHSLPKFHGLKNFIFPLTHGFDLLTMEGPQWKVWRSLFNPGFSTANLMTLLPSLMEDTKIFCDILHERAKLGEISPLENATTNLAMDVIGRVALNVELNNQRSQHPMTQALRSQIKLLDFGNNPLRRLNFVNTFKRQKNKRSIDCYISQVLDDIHRHRSKEQSDVKQSCKSIIDLVLTGYLGQKSAMSTLDPTFRKFAINQVILFIFAGHDTTSSTICYIFYLLSTNPIVLHRTRAEHDQIFGNDAQEITSRLKDNPNALNELPYTLAVIKETLRLFPAASSTRSGEPGFQVTADSTCFPTDGFLVWSLHQAIHRNPDVWKAPEDFIPERWLALPGDVLYPPRNAWRPFEFGPRNCMGQELAVLELKVVLVMVVRIFDITEAYEEWDSMQGCTAKTIKRVAGERAYQAEMQHPSEGFPCRISMRT